MDGRERVSWEGSTSCQLSFLSLSLALLPSFARFLLSAAWAPNCMQGDVWVGGVAPRGLQLNRRLGLEMCSGVTWPFHPWVDLLNFMSPPGQTHSHTEHINPLTPSVLLIDTQDTSSSLSSKGCYYAPKTLNNSMKRFRWWGSRGPVIENSEHVNAEWTGPG